MEFRPIELPIQLPFKIPFPRRHHTDCSIHGPLYPLEVLEKTFRIHRVGVGYDPDEVDDYLDAVAASMMGGGPPVTGWDVRQHEFAQTRRWHHFDIEEVDNFLECIAQTLEGRAGEYPVEQYFIEYAVMDEQGVEYTIEYAVDYTADVAAGAHVQGAYPVEGYPSGWLGGQEAADVGYDPAVAGAAESGPQAPLEVYPPGHYPETLPWVDDVPDQLPPPPPPPAPPKPRPHHGNPPAEA